MWVYDQARYHLAGAVFQKLCDTVCWLGVLNRQPWLKATGAVKTPGSAEADHNLSCVAYAGAVSRVCAVRSLQLCCFLRLQSLNVQVQRLAHH